MRKILFTGFSISLILNLFLGIYTVRQELMYADIKIDKSKNIIPDKETAIAIAYVYIDANLGWEECGEGEYYEPMAFFDEVTNQWEVGFLKRTSNGEFIRGPGRHVSIRSDNGMVTALIRNLVRYD